MLEEVKESGLLDTLFLSEIESARELSFMELFGTADPRFYEIYPWNQAADEGLEIRKSIYNLNVNSPYLSLPARWSLLRGRSLVSSCAFCMRCRFSHPADQLRPHRFPEP